MYDPTLGQFIQRDPIGYNGGSNLYEYVGDDPTDRVDPSGHGWVLPDGCPASGTVTLPRKPHCPPYPSDFDLPSDDPAYPVPIKDANGEGWAYPNYTVPGDYKKPPGKRCVWVCYKKQNSLFIKTPEGVLVHRCVYGSKDEGGGLNAGEVDKWGNYKGTSYKPGTQESCRTEYYYNRWENELEIKTFCDGKLVHTERIKPAPTDPDKVPKEWNGVR